MHNACPTDCGCQCGSLAGNAEALWAKGEGGEAAALLLPKAAGCTWAAAAAVLQDDDNQQKYVIQKYFKY